MLNVLWGKNLNQSSIPNAQVKCEVEEEGRLSFRNAVAMLAIVFCLHSSNSIAVMDDNIPFKIPQQRADTALILFAEQANLTLVFPFDQVKEITANRLVGHYPIDTAINILLQDTGLMPTFSNQLVLNIAIDDKGKSMNKNTRKTLLASMVGLFAAGGVTGASAQVEESTRAQNVLDEVIVTAQKRSASLQEVPIAITAFTGDQLANAGINGSEDLELVTPGLSFLSVDEIGVITIRGIGSPYLQGPGLDASTAVYIDGVYQSRFTSANLKLMDIERVEVLKGPQGVLYGRNSPGGAVNYITKGPQNEQGGKLSFTSGNYDLRRLQASVDVPIVEDTLLFRGTIHKETRDGFTENLLIPSDQIGEEDLLAGRIALKYLPTEELEFTLRAGISEREGGLLPIFKPVKIDPVGPIATAEFIADPRKVKADQPNFTAFNEEYIDLTAKWDMGWATLSSISGYIDREVGPKSTDVDGTELAIGHQDQVRLGDGGPTWETESFSQEFLLTSPGEQRLDWVLGLFYFRENPSFTGGFDAPTLDSFFQLSVSSNTKAYAAFGHVSYNINDKLRVNTGVRYSYEDRDIKRALDVNFELAVGPEEFSDSWSSVTPKLGFDYFINDDVMLYVSASTGFKSGGFPDGLGVESLDEETIDALEFGAKTTLLDGRMTLNTSIFHYDYKDMQVNALDPNTLFNTARNAGSASIQGLELEMSALPLESLQFDVGLSFLDTEFDEFIVDDPRVPSGNLEGNKLPNSPEFTANVGVKYFHTFENTGQLVAQADYYYSSEVFHSEYNDQRGEDAYFNLNLRVSLKSLNETWRVSIFGKNVTDELVRDYSIDSGLLYGDGFSSTFSPPRTYGVELSYQF